MHLRGHDRRSPRYPLSNGATTCTQRRQRGSRHRWPASFSVVARKMRLVRISTDEQKQLKYGCAKLFSASKQFGLKAPSVGVPPIHPCSNGITIGALADAIRCDAILAEICTWGLAALTFLLSLVRQIITEKQRGLQICGNFCRAGVVFWHFVIGWKGTGRGHWLARPAPSCSPMLQCHCGTDTASLWGARVFSLEGCDFIEEKSV